MLALINFSTELFFWFLALGALVLVVIFWPKLAKTSFRHIFIRVSSLILIQVLIVVSAGITINRSGNFYESWGDLFGSKKNLAKIAISPTALSAISPKDLATATRTKGGSLIFKEVITGAKSKVSDYVYVVASPTISKLLLAKNSTGIGTNYQVVELFPGYPGVPQTWIGTLGGITTMENLENAGQIKPTIAIIPAINVVAGQDTECLNYVGGAQVETWLTADMKTLAKNFIGIDDRLWSSFGYSTGGWCAAEVAVRHPEQYGQAISLAGYFEPTFAIGINKRERNFLSNKYNLIKTFKANPSNLKMLTIASKRDRYSYFSTKRFIAESAQFISVKFDEIPNGGHNIKVWKPYVTTGFLWLNSVAP
ncbi:MAG: alpha/beta hydrolase-fold protein [Actinomycetes bacterium]